MNPVSQRAIFVMQELSMAQLPNISSAAQPHVLMSSQSIPGAAMRVNLPPAGAGPSPGVAVKAEQDRAKAEAPAVDLYLCDTSKDGGTAIAEDSKEQASVELLDQWYQSLLQQKLKDTLSSFLPDIPGDFDTGDVQESMLRGLIDRPPIGGREFSPLSNQVLLGFRLHPGPLPEQYRLDPPVASGQHHHQHKKKKHKHRFLEKADDVSIESYPPPGHRDRSPPVDPCAFIRTEHTTNFFHQATPSLGVPHHAPSMIPVMGGGAAPMKFMGAANILSQQPMAAPTTVIVDRPPPPTMPGNHLGSAGGTLPAELQRVHRPKKKRHENGGEGPPKKKKKKDKDRKEKDKDRKRKHHHNQDPGGHPASVSVAMPGAGGVGPGTGPPPLILTTSYPPRTD